MAEIDFIKTISSSRAVLGINKEVERFKLKTCEIDTGNLKSQIINDDEELPVFSKAECDNEKV